MGENLDASRAVLEGASQAIFTKANQERPPGIDTNFINQAQARQDFKLLATRPYGY